MKNLLFTKSAGLIDDALDGAGVAPASTPASETPPATTNGATPSSDSLEAWFARNGDTIGVGIAGLGSGALITSYILKKMHKKEMKKLKQEKQKEENNKTE